MLLPPKPDCWLFPKADAPKGLYPVDCGCIPVLLPPICVCPIPAPNGELGLVWLDPKFDPGRSVTNVEPKLEDGLNGLIELPAKPVAWGCKNPVVELGVAGGGELIAVVPVVCANMLFPVLFVAPVFCPYKLPELNALPNALLPLEPPSDGFEGSFVLVRAKADAKSDMKLLLFPPLPAVPELPNDDCGC